MTAYPTPNQFRERMARAVRDQIPNLRALRDLCIEHGHKCSEIVENPPANRHFNVEVDGEQVRVEPYLDKHWATGRIPGLPMFLLGDGHRTFGIHL